MPFFPQQAPVTKVAGLLGEGPFANHSNKQRPNAAGRDQIGHPQFGPFKSNVGLRYGRATVLCQKEKSWTP